MIRDILIVGAAIVWLVGVFYLASAIYFGVWTSANRLENAPRFSVWFLEQRHFSEIGLRYRARSLRAYLTFFGFGTVFLMLLGLISVSR